jgi:protochlorophyllide reductase
LYSGIGLYAAKLLARINPTNRLILVARTLEKAQQAKEVVLRVLPAHSNNNNGVCVDHSVNFIPLACDHSSLESVRAFPSQLKQKLDETYTREKWIYNGLDVVCLNAAVLMAMDSQPEFTDDGFEVTFQTNHLAPFLLVNLIQQYINPGGRIVVSTSGLHLGQTLSLDGLKDNDTGCIHKDCVMVDGSEFHFKRCYALSKLCNVAITQELEKRLEPRGIVCNCFSPGLMPTSGLFRRQVNSMEVCKNKCALSNEKSVSWGAGALVYMAIADATGRRGGLYWRDAASLLKDKAEYGKEFCAIPINEDEVTPDVRRALWDISCQLTGLS